MSGSSYNYAYSHLEDNFIGPLQLKNDPRRIAFKKLLILVAQAMHDIEWVDSGDYGPEDEKASIDAALNYADINIEDIYKIIAFDGLKSIIDRQKHIP